MTKCILNDKIIDLDKAKVHVSDLALLRAYGVFEFFRLDFCGLRIAQNKCLFAPEGAKVM